jgi:hypothetical protein
MKYFFVHIGKTGGANFRDIIRMNERTYFGYNIFPKLLNSDKPDKNILKQIDFNKYNAFVAHSAYGIHNYVDHDFTYISILRDPVKRIISNYKYNIQRDAYIKSEIYNYKKIPTIQEIIETQPINLTVDVNYVSGINPENIEHFTDGGYPDIDRRIDIALKNLEKENYVFGITNEYDNFLKIIEKKINWKTYKSHKNKTTFDMEISKDDIDFLEERCKKQKLFFESAIKIYKKKYSNLL